MRQHRRSSRRIGNGELRDHLPTMTRWSAATKNWWFAFTRAAHPAPQPARACPINTKHSTAIGWSLSHARRNVGASIAICGGLIHKGADRQQHQADSEHRKHSSKQTRITHRNSPFQNATRDTTNTRNRHCSGHATQLLNEPQDGDENRRVILIVGKELDEVLERSGFVRRRNCQR